jgi:Do/DeqQ family serine protease
MKYAGIAVLASLAIALGLSQTTPATSQAWASPEIVKRSELVADVVEKAVPSVVNISTTRLVRSANPFAGNRAGKSLGSGVIVSASGYILTNNHVVAGARDIKVALSDGRELRARLVGADPKSDLAVLKLTGKLRRIQPIALGSSTKMRLGETVLAIGNPFGVGQTVTQGIVSAKGRANMGILDYEDFIQTDAAINPGNSGGALINLRGELIGINTAILSKTGGSQGIGFAIPSDLVRPIMRSLIKHGKVTRGWLGVSIQSVDDDLVQTLKLPIDSGVLVSDVLAGSPAARAGLRRNDIIVKLDDQPTRSAAQLRTKVASAGAGASVGLGVIRGRKNVALAVRLGELPERSQVASRRRDNSRSPPINADGLGINVARVTRALKQRYDLPAALDRGVVVTGVADGSRAADIGLEPGDVILEVNRSRVNNPRDLERAYQRATDRLALLVFRDGSALYVTINKR